MISALNYTTQLDT